MKKGMKQKPPAGWNEQKVRELIDYYDSQSEDDGAAEIDTANETGQTWISIPTALVPAVIRLIERHKSRAQNGKSGQRN